MSGNGTVRRPALDLGGPEGRSAAELLDERPLNPDRAGLQVDVTRAEGRQFGPPEAGEGAEEHERAVTLIDGVGQGVDLGDGQDWPLCGLLLASAFDPARTRIAYTQHDIRVETVTNVFPSQQWRLSYEWTAE
jgi:hypothetical protein